MKFPKNIIGKEKYMERLHLSCEKTSSRNSERIYEKYIFHHCIP